MLQDMLFKNGAIVEVINMAKYMIHTMPKRLWYVEKYLIPSMINQGISVHDIKIHNDIKHEGNLRACMHAFQEVDTTAEGTWHLQDDVIISHDFKDKTELYDKGIVCGFKSKYDGDAPNGTVTVMEMWFSFLCIRIPNTIAIDCANWCLNYIIGNPVYRDWWEKGTNDDMLFKRYLRDYCKGIKIENIAPNIVDHIDYLIGGSVNSSARVSVIRSKCWEDEYLVEALEKELSVNKEK